MKKSLLLLLVLLFPFFGSHSQNLPDSNQPVSIVTWNIRYYSEGNGASAWPNRKDKVIALLRELGSSVVCMQEVLTGQLDDLLKALPQYSWFGVGRDDGLSQGEFVPVFFDKIRFRFIRGDHFWLSETPKIPGKLGWDAVCPRMATWVTLADRLSSDTLFVFNTHFDHIGVKARLMSAQLLVHAVDSLAGKHPVVITGDFNTTSESDPYRVITGAGYQDSRLVSEIAPVGPAYTFSGFDASKKPGGRIDFIYVRNTKPVQKQIVRDDNFNGFHPSDHLPVMIRFYGGR